MRLFEAQDRQQISYDPFDTDRAAPELDTLTLHQLLKRFEYAPPGYDPDVAERPAAATTLRTDTNCPCVSTFCEYSTWRFCSGTTNA